MMKDNEEIKQRYEVLALVCEPLDQPITVSPFLVLQNQSVLIMVVKILLAELPAVTGSYEG